MVAPGLRTTAVGGMVAIPVDGGVRLLGELIRPAAARGLVIFAHGSGSSRLSPRNRAVAATLQSAGFATLLLDLLGQREAQEQEHVFDVGLLAERLEAATAWTEDDPQLDGLPIGYFGASTGAAAALAAAADLGDVVDAVVSRGGRPDLARPSLPRVRCPVLLIVGALDRDVLELNTQAMRDLAAPKELVIVPGATHLFEEPGALEEVARLAAHWFDRFLGTPHGARASLASAMTPQ